MSDTPRQGSVSSDGFDDFVSGKGGKSKLRKTANLAPASKTASWPTAEQVAEAIKKTGASADVARTPGVVLDPAYFDPLLFYIQHRDRKELNFRLRHAYEYEPVVGNLIDLHRTMPLSDYSLNCRDKSIQKDFEDFADRIELLPQSTYILGDYFLLGESVLYKQWDDLHKDWKEITTIPPEKVEARRTYLTKEPLLLLQVDSELKRLVNSADPVDEEIVKMMDLEMVEKIRTQNRIFLPPSQAYMFANRTCASDLRGTSIVKRALYALLIKYKMRLLHSTYIDRGTFPLKLFKLGDAQSKWIPNRSHFEALRNMLAQASTDPDFSLIYHYGLNVEYIGSKDKWENVLPHYEWCDKEIMIALFANDSLLQSKGQTYSNSNVSVRVLMSRYQTIRTMLELVWKNQIFHPRAEARGYWTSDSTSSLHGQVPSRRHNGKYQYLDVPNFRWSKINLLDDTAQKQFLMRLREKGQIPFNTIAEIFGLDASELRDQLRAEHGTEVDPTWIDTVNAAAKNPSVMAQVLQGDKPEMWVLPEDTQEDKAKKEQKRKKLDTPNTQAPVDVQDAQDAAPSARPPRPAGAPGLPPAAGPGGPAGDLATNPPGVEPPGGQRGRAPGAPTGRGAPPPDLPTEPGQGVTSPPI